MDADIKYKDNLDPLCGAVRSRDVGNSSEGLLNNERADAVNSGLIHDSYSNALNPTNKENFRLGRVRVNKLQKSINDVSENLDSSQILNVEKNNINNDKTNFDSRLLRNAQEVGASKNNLEKVNMSVNLQSTKISTKSSSGVPGGGISGIVDKVNQFSGGNNFSTIGGESEETEAADKAINLGKQGIGGINKFRGIYGNLPKRFKKNLENIQNKSKSSSSIDGPKSSKSVDSVAKTESSTTNVTRGVEKSSEEFAKTSAKAGGAAASAGGAAASGGVSAAAEGVKKIGTDVIESASAKGFGESEDSGAFGAVGLSVIAAPLVPFVILILIVLLVIGICTSAFNMRHSTGKLEGVEAEVAAALMSQGFDQLHTAAIMGNIVCESGMIPGRLERDISNTDYEYLPEEYRWIDWGYGLCQWTNTRRRNPMLNKAEGEGKTHNNIGIQISYLVEESPYQWMFGLDYGVVWGNWFEWNQSTDLKWCTDAWCAFWERPDASAFINSIGKRESEASRIYAALISGGGGGDQSVVDRAMAEIGKPYVWGAVGPEGYDCSGLVSYALSGEHIRLGTTDTFMTWPFAGDPQPGCICTSSYHCGIYIGNGQMIHAPEPGDVVKIGSVMSDMVFVVRP